MRRATLYRAVEPIVDICEMRKGGESCEGNRNEACDDENSLPVAVCRIAESDDSEKKRDSSKNCPGKWREEKEYWRMSESKGVEEIWPDVENIQNRKREENSSSEGEGDEYAPEDEISPHDDPFRYGSDVLLFDGADNVGDMRFVHRS